MKKRSFILLTTLILFFIIVNISFSQDREGPPPQMKEENTKMKTPEEMTRDITDKLHDKLSLNSSQDSLVYQSYQSFFNTIDMFRNVKGKDADAEKLMSDAKTDLNTKMKSILSSEQYDKYIVFQNDMEKKRDEMKNNQRGPGPGFGPKH